MLARRFPVLALRDFRLLLADRLLAPGAFAFSMVGVAFAVLDRTGRTNIPPDRLARVSSYDLLGSVMAMPAGALAAGPIAAAVGVSATQYGAAALILLASGLALIPHDIRHTRQRPSPSDNRPSDNLISRSILSDSSELPHAAARGV